MGAVFLSPGEKEGEGRFSDKRMIQSVEPEEFLSQRVAKGGAWVFAVRITEKSLGLIRLVILARLLAPNDFPQRVSRHLLAKFDITKPM